MHRRTKFLLLALATAQTALTAPAHADNSRQQALVDRSTLAVQDLFQDAKPGSRAQRYLGKARAVMICPSVFHMSVGIGGSGGGCVLVSRDARGSWSDPAFYTLSSGSLGIQLGVESSELMLFVMSSRGLQALLDSQFKFNADASASFATLGSGIGDSTAGVSNTDILALQKSSGLFAGASLGGSKLTVNSGANRSYYNQSVGPEDVVITMRVNNPGADPLRSILSRVAAAQPATTTPLQSQPAQTQPSQTQPTDSASPYPSNYNPAKAYNTQVNGPTQLSPSGVQSQTLPPPPR